MEEEANAAKEMLGRLLDDDIKDLQAKTAVANVRKAAEIRRELGEQKSLLNRLIDQGCSISEDKERTWNWGDPWFSGEVPACMKHVAEVTAMIQQLSRELQAVHGE